MKTNTSIPGLSENLLRYSCTLSLEGGAKLVTTLARRAPHHCWALRAMVDGKVKVVATRVPGCSRSDLALAVKQATAILERRWKGGDDEVAAPVFATFAQLARAYEAGIRKRASITDETIRRAVTSVAMILRETGHSLTSSTSVLAGEAGGELVRKFQAGRLKAVPNTADGETMGRARRSIDGVLNKARSLFTPVAMEIYRAEKLVLPDLAGFRGVPMLGGWNDCAFVPLPARELAEMTRSAWETVCGGQPGVFSAYLLMRRAGMRNGDVAMARVEWLCDESVYVAGFVEPQVVTFLRYRASKNGRTVRVPLAGDVAAALRKYASADGWLVAAQDREETVFRALSAWVRRWIPAEERDKSSYELRKHFGAVVASTLGLDRAAEYLGDRRDTVERHYHAWLEHDRADVARGEDVVPVVVARHLHALGLRTA